MCQCAIVLTDAGEPAFSAWHAGIRMGQADINSRFRSVTGFCIIHERRGLSRAMEMVLTGRVSLAEDCVQFALTHRIVPRLGQCSTRNSKRGRAAADDAALSDKGSMNG
jgi:hypothetical protein